MPDNINSKTINKYIRKLETDNFIQKKMIEKMADKLTTDVHERDWVITYYKNEVIVEEDLLLLD